MSRDDEFDFDDDLFGDDEDEPGDDGGFTFDDDDDLDDLDSLGDFDDVDDDLLIEDEDEESTGPNRTFIVLALVMILIFIIGLGALFLVLTRDTGPSEFEMTEQAIIAFNNTQQAFLEMTQTQAPLDAIATETQVAIDGQAIETAAVLATEAAEQEALAMTAAAEIAATQTAEFAATPTPNELALLQTQQAENLTATAEALLTPLPPEETPDLRPPVTGADAALTATAIAAILLAPPGDPTPTQEAIGGPGEPVPTAPPVALPDTGLFDDFSGNQLSLLMLAFAGLVGVIFGARRLRAMNNRRR